MTGLSVAAPANAAGGDPIDYRNDPGQVCNVVVSLTSGEDDLRDNSLVRVRLQLRNGHTVPLVNRERRYALTRLWEASDWMTGGIPSRQERTSQIFATPFLFAGGCVSRREIVDVVVEYDGSRGGFGQTQDNWDLAAISVREFRTGVILYSRNSIRRCEAWPLASRFTPVRFTGSERVWRPVSECWWPLP